MNTELIKSLAVEAIKKCYCCKEIVSVAYSENDSRVVIVARVDEGTKHTYVLEHCSINDYDELCCSYIGEKGYTIGKGLGRLTDNLHTAMEDLEDLRGMHWNKLVSAVIGYGFDPAKAWKLNRNDGQEGALAIMEENWTGTKAEFEEVRILCEEEWETWQEKREDIRKQLEVLTTMRNKIMYENYN